MRACRTLIDLVAEIEEGGGGRGIPTRRTSRDSDGPSLRAERHGGRIRCEAYGSRARLPRPSLLAVWAAPNRRCRSWRAARII